MSQIKSFIHDESGATAIEYGLIAAFIGIAIIGAVAAVGTSIAGVFSSIGSTLDAAAS